MTSGLENNNKKINIIVYHLIFSADFNDNNIEIFDSFKKNYDVKINIILFLIFLVNIKHGWEIQLLYIIKCYYH